MPDKSARPRFGETAADASSTDTSSGVGSVKATFIDASNTIKEKASKLGQTATDSIDANRGSAAGSLDNAAETLHDRADQLPGGEKVAALAHNTADKLGATAEYVRNHDTEAMMNDVKSFVKSHPAQSLAAAAAVGFLVGKLFQSRD